MLGEEVADRVVAAHAVRQLEHVVALVVEDEVIDVLAPAAQLVDEVADSCSTTRGSFLPWITSSGQAMFADVGRRRALDEEVAVLLRVAEREREVRLPRLRHALA